MKRKIWFEKNWIRLLCNEGIGGSENFNLKCQWKLFQIIWISNEESIHIGS